GLQELAQARPEPGVCDGWLWGFEFLAGNVVAWVGPGFDGEFAELCGDFGEDAVHTHTWVFRVPDLDAVAVEVDGVELGLAD
nr:hypothetical protein [Tanacetum cinerariifolium]